MQRFNIKKKKRKDFLKIIDTRKNFDFFKFPYK